MAKRVKSSSKTAAAEVVVVLPHSGAITDTAQVDLNGQLPDLRQAEVKPVNLMMDYWTPSESGESKTLIFMRVEAEAEIPDFNDPQQTVRRDCAYFIEQTEQGFQILRNASSRLVSMARHFLAGQVYRITFQGLRPNKTNSNKSNYWAVQPVMLPA